VVEVDKGLHVVDGQHTAIAAATLAVESIPVFVVEAPTLDERARAFVGHNTDRIPVSAIGIYRALLASGDQDAREVATVCRKAGVRIRQINQASVVAEGDTMSVSCIRKLVKRRSPMRARQVLECLVAAKLAPLEQGAILAAEHLLCTVFPAMNPKRLTLAIRAGGIDEINAARGKAKAERSAVWKAVAAAWERRLRRDAS
jgi:hypothetical protein